MRRHHASPCITMHLHSLVSATTSPTDHLEPPVERQGRGVVRSHGTCFALHNQTQNRHGHGTIFWQLFVSPFSLLNTPPVSSSLFLLPDPVKPLYATCQYPRIKYCASSILRRPLPAFIFRFARAQVWTSRRRKIKVQLDLWFREARNRPLGIGVLIKYLYGLAKTDLNQNTYIYNKKKGKKSNKKPHDMSEL